MERLALSAQVREGVGKGVARSLRRRGLVPAVVYGRGRGATPVAVDGKAISSALQTHAGRNVLIDLDMAGGGGAEPATVMVKEIQRDVFKQHIIHVDFHAISLTEMIETRVRVVLRGASKGVAEGGIVEHHLRDVLVECMPTLIPEQFDLDITELGIWHSLHASDLVVPGGVTLLTLPDEVVVTIVAPRVQEEAAPAAAVAVEGAPVAAVPEAAPEKE